MKIREAGKIYRDTISNYSEKRAKLQFVCNRYKDKISEAKEKGEDYSKYAEKVAVLELSDNTLEEKQKEYQKHLDDIMSRWEAKINEVKAKNDAEAAKEYGIEMHKIMTVVRRMCKGDIVPNSDEKKVMEFDSKLYMMAKNAQTVAKNEKKKKHKSLWEDEEKPEAENPFQEADNIDVAMEPEQIAPKEIAEAALGELESFDSGE